MKIPSINLTELNTDLRKNNAGNLKMEKEFSNIFLYGELGREYEYLYKSIDHIILLVKNEYETSSYLYNFIAKRRFTRNQRFSLLQP